MSGGHGVRGWGSGLQLFHQSYHRHIYGPGICGKIKEQLKEQDTVRWNRTGHCMLVQYRITRSNVSGAVDRKMEGIVGRLLHTSLQYHRETGYSQELLTPTNRRKEAQSRQRAFNTLDPAAMVMMQTKQALIR